MSFLKVIFRKIFCIWSKIIFSSEDNFVEKVNLSEYSQHLARNMKANIYLPPNYKKHRFCEYPVLILHDAQDMERVKLLETLTKLYAQKRILPIIVCAIFPENRMQEYGTRNQLDYAARGKLANIYQNFIIQKLFPFLQKNYKAQKKGHIVAGFSLGGLSAFDLAWHFPTIFHKVGVFSGALWWRSEKFDPKDPDADRIVHTYVKNAACPPQNQQYWFQTGTNDEKEDRNNNGIIDSIDDTIDLINALKSKGVSDRNIVYREVEGGEHTPETWGEVLPEFLVWAFGK